MSEHLPADLAAAVELGGELGQLFAEFDWAAHPLGSAQDWPAEVRSAVALVLTSRFPIVLWLGAEDLFLVYNDAYIQILGDKHPAALGRPGRDVWWDIWEPISPMLAGVIATGEATWSHDLMLPMATGGRRQERYFTFTYSPLIGEDGSIYGIFCPSFETTERVLSDRLAARLSAAARERRSAATEQLDIALQAIESVPGILPALLQSAGDATAVGIGLLDDEDNIHIDYAGAVPTELRDRYHVVGLHAPLVLGDAIKTGERVVISDTFSLPPRYQHAVQDGADVVRALVIHPLRGGAGRVIGALMLLWPEPRTFSDAELGLSARMAEITQSAVDRIRDLQREHQIAADFQEHLLDLDRGSTAAVVAATYQPAGEALRVGGDWYLVTPLDRHGRLAVSVGDVVGHGLPAAIVMSRLRAAVAATALTDADPAAVLTAMDRYAMTVQGARCATLTYAVIDVGNDGAGISYTCAGHPYPLLLAPGKEPVFLQSGRRPPVGVWERQSARDAAGTELPPGSLVLFYTDGLIERPGEALDHGFARLRAAAADCTDLPVSDICAVLVDRMRPPGGYTDDVAVLALRPSHAAARSFATVIPAEVSHIADARHRLRRWLSAVVADPPREADILLATGEAVTNAIEHGSRADHAGTVSIEGFVCGGSVAVTVSDAGRWSGDSSASLRSQQRGRGLTLINGLADHVQTERTAAGTRISLRFDHAAGQTSSMA
ncbi:SpoIIE family protein phosphatase [Mycobacterium celatum]|uniref:Uncharacterized protein n=2 Tax=Mycobacterium celatum TaxID=28045 RepID=A0A1X1RXA9_MYCCE|nr:SpoIIE family protein phosphatase [Mycobacterium celatum]ORV19591.1 hypothetical protein AWB95_00735 [Mycobacterium celatum]PIB79902.1 hypothetical protein CQY23_06505 [Mycobacterium celatum]